MANILFLSDETMEDRTDRTNQDEGTMEARRQRRRKKLLCAARRSSAHGFIGPIIYASAALLLLGRAIAFEVPFPPSAAEIRASVAPISSSSSTDYSGPQPLTQQLQLGSGTKAEVVTCLPPSRASADNTGGNFLSSLFGITSPSDRKKESNFDKPVLAFIHGSLHASWCWSEKYMPYFASLGYPCVAFSLQGTGGTPTVEEGAKKVKIASHLGDLDAFLKGLSSSNSNNLGLALGNNPRIALIGHSFGGLTIQKWLEQYYGLGEESNAKEQSINLAGVSLLCSVPPSGNSPMTLRFLLRSIRDSWKIIAGFVMKKAITDKGICRDLFFGGADNEGGISDDEIERYQGYFDRDTVATIDLSDLAKQLPSAKADKHSGRAPFVQSLPSTPLVIAASDDFIVDKEGSIETAKYLGLESPVFIDSPHDVMLGDKWKNGADALLEWVRTL
ncbi:hypothetical protein ACHAWF_004922 [Thalassiosira exigua]